MHVAAKSKILHEQLAQGNADLSRYVPDELAKLDDPQTAIPRIAKDAHSIRLIERATHQVPTSHSLHRGDARDMSGLEPQSVHLVLTSPPYWTLKEYRDSEGQLGHVEDYDQFLQELDKVWKQCFQALVPGGRLICVVGDVCLSRRENGGKISNAAYEVEGGSTFLGKPYEPNSVIKNDIEFILMERKPGGYRAPDISTKVLSVISAENHKKWFQQIWSGVTGASTRQHPAPYPLELAERLVRMFSFVGDTVLDPFMGTGTTTVAAAKWGRNSIGFEIDRHYYKLAQKRISEETSSLFSTAVIHSARAD